MGRQTTEERLPAWGIVRWALSAAVAMIVLLYVPTPYVVYEPGLVAVVDRMVEVDHPDERSEGEFMLTTIKMSYANFWTTFRSAWDRNLELYRKKDVFQGKTETEYKERLVFIMRDSQSSAIAAAYEAAGIAYSVEAQSVWISSTPPAGELPLVWRAGDVIVAIEGEPVTGLEQLAVLLAGRSAGDELEVLVQRGDDQEQLRVPLIAVPGSTAELPAALGGVQIAESRAIVPADLGRRVTIQASNIGGPSAGLMFALQTVDKLTAGDLSRGWRVAGTGTIEASGKVGSIGGVALKIAAAAKEGAEVFLVPEQNAEDARRRAEQLGTEMQVIPVASLQQALEALAALEPAK